MSDPHGNQTGPKDKMAEAFPPLQPDIDDAKQILLKLIDTGVIWLTKADVLDMGAVDKYAYARERLREEQRAEIPATLEAIYSLLASEAVELADIKDLGSYQDFVLAIPISKLKELLGVAE